MRKLRILFFGLAALFAANTAIAQQGIGTHLPERSSVLELKSENRGLLIPRVTLSGTNNKGPIHGTPAHSLLVYNTVKTGDVVPGFYYWVEDATLDVTEFQDGGYWEAFLTNKNFDGKAGDGIYIDEDGNISIDTRDGSGTQGTIGKDKVLVTVEDANGDTVTEWVDRNELLNAFVDSRNGITKIDNEGETIIFELGGALTRDTEINTSGNKFTVISGGNKFEITGLNTVEVKPDGTIDTGSLHEGDDFAASFDVLIVDAQGVVQKVNPVDLLKDAVEVKNGLTFDTVDGKIKLGGDLTEETEITLNEFDFVLDATEDKADVIIKTDGTDSNLQLEGLTEVTTDANKMLVVDDANNVRTVTRMISAKKTGGFTINATDVLGYTPFVQEVILEVKPEGEDAKVNLPAIASTTGQIINIVVDKTASTIGDFYVEIYDGGTKVREGYEPAKGWVFKSNGTDWILVSEY